MKKKLAKSNYCVVIDYIFFNHFEKIFAKVF